MAYQQSVTTNPTVRVSSQFGWRTDPITGQRAYHGGEDFILSPDTTIHAPASGTVVTAHAWGGGTSGADSWGNYIVIQFAAGQYYLIGHMAGLSVSVGQTVNVGDAIGVQGSTGRVTGPHVHFEYWAGGYGTAYRSDPSGLLGWPNVIGTYEVEFSGEPGPGPGPIPPGPTPEPYIIIDPYSGTYRKPFTVTITAETFGQDYEIYYSIDRPQYDSLARPYTRPFKYKKRGRHTVYAFLIINGEVVAYASAEYNLLWLPPWMMAGRAQFYK